MSGKSSLQSSSAKSSFMDSFKSTGSSQRMVTLCYVLVPLIIWLLLCVGKKYRDQFWSKHFFVCKIDFNWKGGSDNGKESNDDVEISKKS